MPSGVDVSPWPWSRCTCHQLHRLTPSSPRNSRQLKCLRKKHNFEKILTWNFLPCCLELVGSWVVPVDVARAGNETKVRARLVFTLSGRLWGRGCCRCSICQSHPQLSPNLHTSQVCCCNPPEKETLRIEEEWIDHRIKELLRNCSFNSRQRWWRWSR